MARRATDSTDVISVESLPSFGAASEFTISMWIKLGASSTTGGTIFDCSSPQRKISSIPGTGPFSVLAEYSDSNDTATTAVNDLTLWGHYAFVYAETVHASGGGAAYTGYWKTYADGGDDQISIVGVGTTPVGDLSTGNATGVKILNSTSADDAFCVNTESPEYPGPAIAEVGVWSRALTLAEIANLANGYAPSLVPTGLVAYWDMIGTDEDTEVDQSGNEHDGTVTGTEIVEHVPGMVYEAESEEEEQIRLLARSLTGNVFSSLIPIKLTNPTSITEVWWIIENLETGTVQTIRYNEPVSKYFPVIGRSHIVAFLMPNTSYRFRVMSYNNTNNVSDWYYLTTETQVLAKDQYSESPDNIISSVIADRNEIRRYKSSYVRYIQEEAVRRYQNRS